jgi:PDZ domain-containing protein
MPSRAARHGVGQILMSTLTWVCGCQAGPAVHGPPRAAAEPLATVPLTSVGGMVFVAVGGDSAPARLWLLDSGFETSVVNRRYADSLRLPQYAHQEQVAPGGHTDVGVVPGIRLHVGPVTFRPESLAVIDLHNVEPLLGVAYAGILGHDFLMQYVTRVDYDRRVVELFAPPSFVYTGPGYPLPVWIEANEPFALGLLYVKGRTVPAKLKLDTGSLDVLGLNGSFVQQTDLTRGGARGVPALGAAVGGKVAAYLIRLDSVTIGGSRLARPIVGYSGETERRGDAGTVGMGFLNRFNLVFDYARRRVILEPTARTDRPLEYDASGLLLTAGGPNFQGITVLSVASGSPADVAGIQAGDSLVAIDGESPSRFGLSGVRERFSHAGAVVQLVVMRRGTERRMLLRLRPRL